MKGRANWNRASDSPDPLPAPLCAVHIPADLLRQVARPHDQELGEGDIGPEQDAGDQKVADVVQMVRRDHLGKRLIIGQHRRDHHRKGHGSQQLTDEK